MCLASGTAHALPASAACALIGLGMLATAVADARTELVLREHGLEWITLTRTHRHRYDDVESFEPPLYRAPALPPELTLVVRGARITIAGIDGTTRLADLLRAPQPL